MNKKFHLLFTDFFFQKFNLKKILYILMFFQFFVVVKFNYNKRLVSFNVLIENLKLFNFILPYVFF